MDPKLARSMEVEALKELARVSGLLPERINTLEEKLDRIIDMLSEKAPQKAGKKGE